MFIYLPIPIDGRVPDGYKLIVAYAKDDEIVAPLDVNNLNDEKYHDCDWEGCSSVDHVFRISIKQKYENIK